MRYHFQDDSWQVRMKAAVFVAALMLFLVVLVCASKAAELCAGIPDVTGLKPVREDIAENGLMYRAFDLDGDGQIDHVQAHVVHSVSKEGEGLLVSIPQYPLLYEIDDNGDHKPDRVMIDKAGKGSCADIVLYKDLTLTHQRDTSSAESAGI